MLGFISFALLVCGEKDAESSSEACVNPDPNTTPSPPGIGETIEDKMHDIMTKVMNSDLVDKVMHSDLMDKVMHSKMMEELKALPRELRESLILHVERRSLVVAGVVVAVVAALLLLGCVWIHWCHSEQGEYRWIPVSQVDEFVKYQKMAEEKARARRHKHARHKHKEEQEGGKTPDDRRHHRRYPSGDGNHIARAENNNQEGRCGDHCHQVSDNGHLGNGVPAREMEDRSVVTHRKSADAVSAEKDHQ